MKKDRPVLSGYRFVVRFQNGKLLRQELERPVRLEIAAPPSGDYSAAIAAVLAPTLEALAPGVSDDWLPCLKGEVPKPVEDPDEKQTDLNSLQVPVPIFRPQPDHASDNYEVFIQVRVDRCGNPVYLAVTRTSDPRRDKIILSSYRQWLFKPAMLHGRTVEFETQIHVVENVSSTLSR